MKRMWFVLLVLFSLSLTALSACSNVDDQDSVGDDDEGGRGC